VRWVELAADGTLSVRSVAASGTACPTIEADGRAVAAQPRGVANDAFPVEVCEATAPAATRRITIEKSPLPAPPERIDRIIVIGDSGCRVQRGAVQDCGDPLAWPFAAIAKGAAAKRPDLVIHVGDYYYRERACPAGRVGCAGSPYGDTWATWRAELFEPAAPLLAAAPWVVVRGNHEVCRRGGQGWVRLLDPHPLAACADRSEPYLLSIGGLNLLLFDGSDADDFRAPADKVAAYRAQLVPLLAKAPPHTWFVTHRPVWAMAQAELVGLSLNATEQAALRGRVPPALDLALSGHLHDFISYDFGPERPSQLVVGTGGDTLLPLGRAAIEGSEIDGMKVRRGVAVERFGYLLLERTSTGWDGTLYAPDEEVLARCRLAGRDLECR